jgi:hypothetical protein
MDSSFFILISKIRVSLCSREITALSVVGFFESGLHNDSANGESAVYHEGVTDHEAGS